MMRVDKEALECDLAETYGIYDINSLPISKIAIFAKGLRENSRIKKTLGGLPADLNTILLTTITDSVNWLVWSKTKDGSKNKNKPKSLLSSLYGKTKKTDAISLKSGKEYEKMRKEIIESIRKEGKWLEQN